MKHLEVDLLSGQGQIHVLPYKTAYY